MKKWMQFCRNSWVKLAFICLFVAATAAVVGSLQWFYNYMRDTNQGEEAIFENYNRGYEDTTGFQEEFTSRANTIAYGIQAKEIFETDGAFDGDKVIDVMKYYEDGTIPEKASGDAADPTESAEDETAKGDTADTADDETAKNDAADPTESADGGTEASGALSFRLNDLLRMESMEDADEYMQVVVCRKKNVGEDNLEYEYMQLEDFLHLLDGGYTTEEDYGGYADSSGVDCGKVYDEDGSLIYKACWTLEFPELAADPLQGSWLDLFNSDPELNGSMSDAVNTLTTVAEDLCTRCEMYETANAYADTSETNLRYVLYNEETKQLYSNVEGWDTAKEYATYLEQLQQENTYLYWNDGRASFVQNAKSKDSLTEFYDDDALDGWKICVSVDAGFAADDIFAQQEAAYEQYAGNAEIMRSVLCAGAAVLVVSLIVLSFGLGVAADGTVELYAFDRLKTEIAFALVIGVWGLFFGIGLAMIETYGGLAGSYLFWGGMISLPTAALFLVGYGSLLKRLRAHTLWENSICRLLVAALVAAGKWIAGQMRNIKLIWKYALAFAAFCFLHWFAIVGYGGILVLPVIAAELAVAAILLLRAQGEQRLLDGLRAMVAGSLDEKIDDAKLRGAQKEAAELLNHIEDGLNEAIDERMKSERMKTELITNVSHDIKTPLTSILSYIDLLKRELARGDAADPQKLSEYLDVLDRKSQRLKTLTEDVVEASKISTGNITLEYTQLDLVETLLQIEGEYAEKLEAAQLSLVRSLPEPPVPICADGRRVWRIFGNLYQNAAKYAMPNTRVYMELKREDGWAVFTLKNISEAPLNIDADELTERFIRGDRARTTEGSGLGLSIARSLTEAMKGTFAIVLDGDLFKVTVRFPLYKKV